jgi:hypothetical protein
MAKIDDNAGKEPLEQAEALSATGMFLRAFESTPEATQAAGSSSAPVQGSVGWDAAELPQAPAPARPTADRDGGIPRSHAPSSGPGEFTSLFQTSGGPASRSTPAPVERAAPPPSSPLPQAAGDTAPGEFTRIFVSGKAPAASAPAKKLEDILQSARSAPPTVGPSKGFSSPGQSASASSEGSFTQFLKAAASPGAAAQPVSPAAKPDVSHESFARDTSSPFGETARSSESSGPSVTSLLSSLSSPAGPAGPSSQESPAYRTAPRPSTAMPSPPSSQSQIDSGGVTRLIQKLAQEQSTAPAAPPPPPAAPMNAGPGEFTRMISRMGSESAPAAPPQPAAAAPAAFAAPPVAFQMPAAPAVNVAVQVPAMQAPAFHASAQAPAAPKFPAAPAIPVPPAPKLAPVAVPAAPKTRLEALVPVLLVVNTFLLLVLLVVVIFMAKGR